MGDITHTHAFAGGTSLRAAFRGRLMDGYKTVLPEGVVGLVVQETGSAAPLGGEPSAASVAPPAASNRSSSSSSSSSAAAAKKPMTAAARRLAAKRKGPVITKGRAGDDDDEEDFGVTFDSDDDDDDEDDGEDGDVFGGSYNDNDDDGDGVGAGGGGVDQPHRRVWRIEGSFKEITYWCAAFRSIRLRRWGGTVSTMCLLSC